MRLKLWYAELFLLLYHPFIYYHFQIHSSDSSKKFWSWYLIPLQETYFKEYFSLYVADFWIIIRCFYFNFYNFFLESVSCHYLYSNSYSNTSICVHSFFICPLYNRILNNLTKNSITFSRLLTIFPVLRCYFFNSE